MQEKSLGQFITMTRIQQTFLIAQATINEYG